jgi:hypothetical protein
MMSQRGIEPFSLFLQDKRRAESVCRVPDQLRDAEDCSTDLKSEVALRAGHNPKDNMKKTFTLLAALFLGAALFNSAAVVVVPLTITVDENGNGTIDGTPLAWTATYADPGPGRRTALFPLTYILPVAFNNVQAGDIQLYETLPVFEMSDYLRFNPFGTENQVDHTIQQFASLVFYSNPADGIDSLADVPFPGNSYPISLFFPEQGTEAGPNGYWNYTPIAGQPGYVPGLDVTYNFISDPVPEPSTAAIAGAFLLLSFGARKLGILRTNGKA